MQKQEWPRSTKPGGVNILNTLCEVTTQGSGNCTTMEHHFTINQQANGPRYYINHNHSSGCPWACGKRTRRSLVLTFSTLPKDAFVSVMADTGCQSCLIGLKIITKLVCPSEISSQ